MNANVERAWNWEPDELRAQREREREERERAKHQTDELAVRLETLIASGMSRQWIGDRSGVSLEFLEALFNRHASIAAHKERESFRVWVEENDRSDKLGLDALLPTPTSLEIRGICAATMEDGSISVITGAWGVGKSLTLSAFAYSNPKTSKRRGALYHEVTVVDLNTAAILASLAQSLGITEGSAYRSASVYKSVVSRIGPGDLIIVDETNKVFEQRVNGAPLDLFRDIQNHSGCGLVVAGNPVAKRSLLGERSEYAALMNRAMHLDIPHTTEQDAKVILDHLGVNGKRARRIAIENAKGPTQNGGLRKLFSIYRLAIKLANGERVSDAAFIGAMTKSGWV